MYSLLVLELDRVERHPERGAWHTFLKGRFRQ